MSFLDNLLASFRYIYSNGTLQPQRTKLNFTTGLTITDDGDTLSVAGTVGPGFESATPQPIGTASAGSGTTVNHANHVHAHGDQATSNTMHAVAVSGGNAGFMTGVDKGYMDALSTSMWWSPVSRAVINPTNYAGSFTVGFEFRLLNARTITGIKFYAHWASGTKSVKCSLWDYDGGSQLATVTVSGCTSGNIYTATFSSPVAITDLSKNYAIGVWETSGTYYCGFQGDGTEMSKPFMMSKEIMIIAWKFSAGDARPTSTPGTERYGCEPILSI